MNTLKFQTGGMMVINSSGKFREAFSNAADALRNLKAVPVVQFVFGGSESLILSDEKAIADPAWPVMPLCGDGTSAAEPVSIQTFALAAGKAEGMRQIELDGHCIGSTWEDEDARYLFLANVHAPSGMASPEQQALESYNLIERVLASEKMHFPDIVRMWNYLSGILDWYDGFNQVRTAFFNERQLLSKMIPAATGIGARHAAGFAYAGAVLALSPKLETTKVISVASPLQCPPTKYKSSFSRALETVTPHRRTLYVSGTASIDPVGNTVHPGDVSAQINLTMEVIHAILESRGYLSGDVVRAIAYFTDAAFLPEIKRLLSATGWDGIPVIFTEAAICRHDLLFEVELDAVWNV